MHVGGEPIEWEENGDPAAVDGDDLVRRIRLVAVASLLARAWPIKGARHDAALAVGGFLARAGVPESDAGLMIEAIPRAAGDPEWRDRVRTARTRERATKRPGRFMGSRS